MTPVAVATLDLNSGAEYVSRVHNRHNLCRVIRVATSLRSRQDAVVYQVYGGPDNGKCFYTPLMDFALRFERKPAEPAAAPAEVVADLSDKGKGF